MAGKKSSVYLYAETEKLLEQARNSTGREISINGVVNESAALYAEVVKALNKAPGCTVRFTPKGWVVEPYHAAMA